MRKSLVAFILFLISYIIANCTYVIRGMNISSDDPRLLTYDDSIYINKHLIDSLLRKMYGKYPANKQSNYTIDVTAPTPLGNPDIHNLHFDEAQIIELANTFVKEGKLSIPYDYGFGPIKKSDIKKLHEAFDSVKCIESKDIIDVINIQKRINLQHIIDHIEISCLYQCQLIDFYGEYDEYGELDSLWHELDIISRKYTRAVKNLTACKKRQHVFNSPLLSIDAKIELLTCMIEKLKNVYEHDSGYETAYNGRIERWTLVLDSLMALSDRQ